jgi:DNA-binding CsgD family transcriptional regulator
VATNREHRPRLYGRQDECETLAGLVNGVRHGDSAALVVHGEPGTGKTALLEYAAGLATDLPVTRATGTESEAELAYSGLHQLCGPLLGRPGNLPGPQSAALEVVFGMTAGPRPGRLLVGVALLSLLAESAAGRPLVCVIDDAQWLDRESGQALAFAARRLAAEPVLMIFAARGPVEDLAGLPELVLAGLRDADARDLFAGLVRWPLDEQVREQIVAETRGNPRALRELLRGLSPAQLAGGFRLPEVLPGQIPGGLQRQLADFTPQTRLLLRIAAADPTGDPALVWQAAGLLGIPPQAAVAATEAGLVKFGSQVIFRDLVVRSAAYQGAPSQDRWAAHQALARATHWQAPDRRAWHRSQVQGKHDEDAAAALERAASRAQARGGLAAAAAFLERAAMLTPDAARRSLRTLGAAEVMLQAGEPGVAVRLLDVAETEVLDDHQQARADFVRARCSFTVNRGGDAPRLLLDAAQRLDRFDVAEARAAYLEAIGAALFATPLAGPGGSPADVAAAARKARPADVPGLPDLLLDGLAACFSEGSTVGAPILRRALRGLCRDASDGGDLRHLRVACAAAVGLWDDEAWDTLASQHVRLARETGALGDLPLALSSLACLRLVAGDLAAGQALTEEARVIAETTGAAFPPYGVLGLAALRGRPEAALTLIEGAEQDATLRGEGLGVVAAKWAAAVLYNGLGRYGEALSAAAAAAELAGSALAGGWSAAELIEAAARTGQPGRAAAAMRHLAQATSAAGTDWALGVQARSLALLSEGGHAEDQYQAAIGHLGRSRARVDLARAHLLYGEWLRREGRRTDARGQLRRAHEMLTEAGADRFAERARRELLATGETVRKRALDTDRELTAQELQVALRARDGRTNVEIGAELFLSPRTVEWHLRKVFVKLGIASRRQLQQTLPSTTCC